MKQIAIGIDDFRTIRESNSLYVDKSLLIKEVLTRSTILLLPRPRRFGKTLNMTMLHSFFDMKQDSRALFEGLEISADTEAMTHLNGYPTVFLTLKGIKAIDWPACCSKIVQLVGNTLARPYPDLDLSQLSPSQRDHFQAAYDQKAPVQMLTTSLKTLIELLYRSTGKKVVLLIDEYDSPIHHAHAQGYYPQIIDFMRDFLGEALKGNPYLERAVITGILRIGKESIYSGLNNLAVYSILEPHFSTCFGFTENEVNQILQEADLCDKGELVRSWYNGYRFGQGEVIYNPWSILNYVSRSEEGLKAHWLSTSGNDLAREMIQERTGLDLQELELLIQGKSVRKHLNVQVGMRDLNAESIWNILLFTGYLTAENYDPTEETADLRIPNMEVRHFFKTKISSWLGPGNSDHLIKSLLSLNLADFARHLAEAVRSILSFHDTGGTTPERIYHIFVVGLIQHLRDRFRIQSNRESGHGRADLVMIPNKPGATGYIFEFKASGSRTSLKRDAQKALAQIKDRDYLSNMREAGVQQVAAIGLTFFGKRIALASQIFDISSAQLGELQTYSAGSQEPEVPVSPTGMQQEQTQKAKLVGRIQTLQQIKGKAITAETTLMRMDLEALEAFAESLAP